MSGMTVNMRGQKEARHLLDSLSDRELQNRTRRATRRGAKVFRTAVRAEAKSRSDIPNSFAKTATKGHRSPVGTSTGPTSPLLNIFEGGAGGHTISAGTSHSSTSAHFLAGPAGERWRSRDFLAGGTVHHPGMGARPLIGPVFDANEEKASAEAMDEILTGLA